MTILYVNNFTNTPVKNISVTSEADSWQLYTTIYDTEHKIESTIDSIEQLFVESDGDANKFYADLNLLSRSTINDNNLISGYLFIPKQGDGTAVFYHKDIQGSDNILFYASNANPSSASELTNELSINQLLANHDSGWYSLFSPSNQEVHIAYISYLNNVENPIGYIGYTVDSADFTHLINKGLSVSNNNSVRKKILINNSGQVLYDSSNSNPNLVHSTEISYSEIVSQALSTSAKSDTFLINDPAGNPWICIAHNLPGKTLFIEASKRNHIMASADKVILIIAFTALIALFFVQSNSKDGLSIFEKACNRIMRRYITNVSPLEESSTKAALSLHFGGILTLTSYLIFILIYQPSLTNILLALGLLTLVVVCLNFYKTKSLHQKTAKIYIIVALITPLLIHLYFGGFSGYARSASIFWIWMSFILALFIVSRQYARKIFSCFIVVVFAEVIVEMLIYPNIDYQSLYFYILNLLALGFALYSTIDIYVVRTVDNHAKTLNMLEELKDSQSTLVQREKMIILGQLISGVAHEINTPIGAIKASAETISTTLEHTLRSVMKNSNQFTEEDYNILFKIINQSSAAISAMRATSELRRQRNALRKYLEEIELPYSNEIVDALFRLEICDLDMVKENIDMFKSPKIKEILSVVCSLSSLIVGTETILVATGKVSKIVFALKSYSHTNISDEFVHFDLVKGIETVLLLYHNQIKSSVIVERDYDENMPLCYGNSDELSQVWTNLVQNALYAMSNSGTLCISIKYSDYKFTVTISDTGAGVSEEDIKKIFDPFYTTKPLGEGSGLGLDICNKIILKHNGTIDVKSALNLGSTFTVVLPIDQKELHMLEQ